VIDTLVNGDDNNKAVAASAENFDSEGIWRYYKGQREQYRGGFGPQVAAKKVQRIGEFSAVFQPRVCSKTAEETNCYAIQFQNSHGRLFS
jgi:hypothetical protein